MCKKIGFLVYSDIVFELISNGQRSGSDITDWRAVI